MLRYGLLGFLQDFRQKGHVVLPFPDQEKFRVAVPIHGKGHQFEGTLGLSNHLDPESSIDPDEAVKKLKEFAKHIEGIEGDV